MAGEDKGDSGSAVFIDGTKRVYQGLRWENFKSKVMPNWAQWLVAVHKGCVNNWPKTPFETDYQKNKT